MRGGRWWWLVAAAVLATGCGGGEPHRAGPSAVPASEVVLPPEGGVVSYQLGGAYDLPTGSDLVVRDVADRPAAGSYSVCYLNAFQTQPGADLEAVDGLLLRDGDQPVTDPDWPDEVLYDTGSPQQRDQVAELVSRDLDRCAASGFDAVELDNLDSFTRSHGLLEAGDNLELAAVLVDLAHERGLAVAQKNLAERVEEVAALGFDLAVVEECAQLDECGEFLDAYGGRVYAVEYTDAQGVPFDRACELHGDRLGLVLRDRDLLPAGEDGHVERACP